MVEVLVHIVRTGTANLASIDAGLKRLGVTTKITNSRDEVEEAKILVLPGVGTLAAAMDALEKADLVTPLRDRIQSNRPTLAVCLGMQLLAAESEENPGIQGLGCFPGRVRRFPEDKRIPQLGWNNISAPVNCRYLTDGYFYFANSYCLTEVPDGWIGATADYGFRFVAAIERGSILACQFHPELSGENGLSVLKSWLDQNAPEKDM